MRGPQALDPVRVADSVRARAGVESWGRCRLNEVCDTLGVCRMYRSARTVAEFRTPAFVASMDDGFVIGLASDAPRALTRVRFMVAHELGHIVTSEQGEFPRGDGVELFCDEFARALLMPRGCIPSRPDVGGIVSMSETYGLPVVQVAIAVSEIWGLDLHIAVVDARRVDLMALRRASTTSARHSWSDVQSTVFQSCIGSCRLSWRNKRHHTRVVSFSLSAGVRRVA